MYTLLFTCSSILTAQLINAAVLGDFEQRHSTSQNGKSAQVLDKKETSLEIDVNSEALRSSTLCAFKQQCI